VKNKLRDFRGAQKLRKPSRAEMRLETQRTCIAFFIESLALILTTVCAPGKRDPIVVEARRRYNGPRWPNSVSEIIVLKGW
jgi:hypothetical protein